MAKDPEVPSDFNPRSISNFRNQIINRGGVQIANRYVVDFVTPFGTFTTYPSELNIPPRALRTYDAGQPSSLWGTVRKVPIQHEYDVITMSFVLYEDWAEKNFIDSWMDKIVNKQKSDDQYFEYSNTYFDYIGKIYINTLKSSSQTDNPVFTSKTLLDEAYPLSMLPISIAADNTGYTTFVCSFAFRHYYNLKLEED